MAGRAFRFFQAGDIQRYLAAFAIGVAVIVWVAARPAPPEEVRVTVEGRTVKVELADPETASGVLKYRFDFDGDGTPDREGSAPSATWLYSSPDRYTVTITIEDSRWQTRRILARSFDIR
jgi:hypothetical protein